MIEQSCFGFLSDGGEVTKYRIINASGASAEILDYGGIIYSICVPDREGTLANRVLAVPDAAHLQGRSYSAITIGRVANRIAGAHCVIAGKEYHLEAGRGGNFMHGGSGSYSKKLFSAMPQSDGKTVALYLRDQGEGGFHNRVDVWVYFTFDDDNSLSIQYVMVPLDEATVLSPTNHAYFNLSGRGDVRKQILTLNASNLALVGESGAPCGGVMPVAGTPADFTAPRQIGQAIASDPDFFPRGGFDHFYVLDRENGGFAAELFCPETGCIMRTYTDAQSVILYTPTDCAGKPDVCGTLTEPFSAVCLEAQFVPNAVNLPEFDSPVFFPGQRLDSTTRYVFSVR